ncbi:enoyl-CoA hydratase [Photobacterium aquae]|uniref:Enoyl-CoA hydratase n=1 Tax=Photobacterium aquae TaxID=1195763 RepID=A0A0J1GVB9_9GAMM|nr:crotonase/enoyl-CoA hydratase family protein [Photobacterium aquae]KLV03364.1 enoyl-CoA hydratase [Photobacterium aquae]
MEWHRINVEDNNGIVTVSLNRPDKMNALDMKMFQELDAISKRLRKQKHIRAVILRGEGGNFSSGLDIKSVATSKSKAISLLAKWLPGNANLAQRVSRNWRKLPFPVIGVIEGRCYGGGMQIVLGADFRIAEPDAELSIMEVRWGLVPDMAGLMSLREVVAKDIAMRLTMTGEIVTASQALSCGLVTELSHQPMERAKELVGQLAQASPDALAAIKLTTNRCWHGSERFLLAHETFSQLRLLLGRNFTIAGRRQRKQEDLPYRSRQSFW